MKGKLVRVALTVLTLCMLTVSTLSPAYALSWDGSSSGGGGGTSPTSPGGYAVRYANAESCVVGYRFSVINNSGTTKGLVIDMYKGSGGFNNPKFSSKYNKADLIRKQNNGWSTSTSTCLCIKQSELGISLPAPSGMGAWQEQKSNLNPILREISPSLSVDNLIYGDKVLVEPIIEIAIAGTYHSFTVTEMALYGKHMLGVNSNGGSSSNSGSWGFIAIYTNKNFPNLLRASSGYGIWTGVSSALTSQATFYDIINKGYGVGVAYTQTQTQTFKLDVNGIMNGARYGNTSGFGTFDVYINGQLAANDVNDFYKTYPQGTSYRISDVRAKSGYLAMPGQNITGSLNGDTAVDVSYITDNKIHYKTQGGELNTDIDNPNDYVLPENGVYNINVANSTKYMHIEGAKWDKDRRVVIWEGTGGAELQASWYIQRYKDTPYYTIVSDGSSLFLSSNGGNASSGQPAKLKYAYSNGVERPGNIQSLHSDQLWFFVDEGGGAVSIHSVAAPGQVLDVTGGVIQNDSVIQFYAANHSAAQKFKLQSVFTGQYVSTVKRWGQDAYITTSQPVKEGYTFTGWNTMADGSGTWYQPGQRYYPDTTVTLYAQWEPIAYTIVFNGNGATGGSTASMSMTYNEEKNLTANGFTRTGYTFICWNTKADGSGTGYSDGQSVKNLTSVNGGTVILYAQWGKDLVLEPIEPNAAYRETTKVISSYWLINDSDKDYTPADHVTLRFDIQREDGSLYQSITKQNVVVPANEKNLLYIKWEVPEGLEGSKMIIQVSLVQDGEDSVLASKAYTTSEYTICQTQDTTFEFKAPASTYSSVPSTQSATVTWSEFVYEDGDFVEKTYQFRLLTQDFDLIPDSESAFIQGGQWSMKSGYGFSCEGAPTYLGTALGGYLQPTIDSYTIPQYAYALYPEYGYAYGEETCTTLTRGSNPTLPEFMDYGKVHFTPIWYPDGGYTVAVVSSDCWTPMGMVKATTTQTLQIEGSVYDDWYVGRR